MGFRVRSPDAAALAGSRLCAHWSEQSRSIVMSDDRWKARPLITRITASEQQAFLLLLTIGRLRLARGDLDSHRVA